MSTTDPHVAKMEAQLHEWKASIDGMKAKAEKATAQGRIDLQKQTAAFETHYADASRQFNEFKSAGEDKVAAIKVGLEKAWGAFKVEFDKAKA